MTRSAIRSIGLGFCLGLLLAACTSMGFSYRYYGLRPSEGLLLADKPENDQPLSKCEPDAQEQGKCVVFFRDEFFKLKADYLKLEQALDSCQRGRH